MTVSSSRLSFGQGLKSLPRAVGVLRRAPRILGWLLPPLLITLVLDVAAFYFAFGWLRDWIGSVMPSSGAMAWLKPGIDVLGAIAIVFVLGWSFAWLFLVLASPFQDFISAAVERETRGTVGAEPEGFRGFLRSITKSALQAAVLAVATLLFLVVGLVPVIGPVLVFLWSASVLGYSFVAIPSGRVAQGLRKRLAFARQHRGAVLGLGTAITLVSMVPLVNVLCMPVFVVAGTLLFLDGSEQVAPSLPGRAPSLSAGAAS
jgi:CysZ protein